MSIYLPCSLLIKVYLLRSVFCCLFLHHAIAKELADTLVDCDGLTSCQINFKFLSHNCIRCECISSDISVFLPKLCCTNA